MGRACNTNGRKEERIYVMSMKTGRKETKTRTLVGG
jgi:hypothetical protein